jgi:hypothetical protein
MKNSILGLFILGFASLSYSQSENGIREVQLANVDITPLNISYLNAVANKNAPKKIKHLEDKVARYDITESPVYEKQFDAYEVTFKGATDNGRRIKATYDSDGKILKSFEKFDNIALPMAIRNTVNKKYPGWTIYSDTYLVSYYDSRDIKKVYKLKIKKDNEKKILKIDVDGTLI